MSGNTKAAAAAERLIKAVGNLLADIYGGEDEQREGFGLSDLVTTLDSAELTHEQILDELRKDSVAPLTDVVTAACAYGLLARRVARAGDDDSAWLQVARGNRLLGHAEATFKCATSPGWMSKVIARKGREGAIQTSVAAQQTVRTWCEGKLDQYASLNEMADDAHAAQLDGVTQSRSRIREWIGTYAIDWRNRGLWTRN
jgi:hypothetical protein